MIDCMKLLLFFACLVVAATAEGVVEEITDDTFEQTHQGVWFLKFFVPWCGHCQTLAPKWKELASVAEGRYHVAEVDCRKNRVLCSDVRLYPTLRLYIEGKENPIVFTGNRDVESMNFFVEYHASLPETAADRTTEKLLRKAELLMQRSENNVNMLENSVKRMEHATFGREQRVVQHNFEQRGRKTRVELITANNFNRVYHGAWIIRFYSSKASKEESMTEMWDEMANQYGTMFHVAEIDCENDGELCRLEGFTNYPSFVLYLDGTIGPSQYKGEHTIEKIAKYVTENIEAVNEDFDDPKKGVIDEKEIQALRELASQYLKQKEQNKEQKEQKEEL